MKEIKNQDIIDFRYKLIDMSISDVYFAGVICNDGTNVMTIEKKKVIEDILIMYNNHFGCANYELG